jgi:sugar (glycoside-pentoside-hexuronide) transporter
MSNATELKAGETERLPFWRVGVYGLGNFASNLSWTMVSSYLAIFYTDAVGLSAAAVATMLLVTRIWDAANDPVMGLIAERTRSRWGRFRPYILFGPLFLALMTILTFRNPGLNHTGNLVYAYITYTILGMVYTATNVPYNGMAMAITRNRFDFPRISVAFMIAMNVAQISLNMLTQPLVGKFGGGDMSKGYQSTAALYAITAMFLFWVVFAGTKEVFNFTKKSNVPLLRSFKVLFASRNICCAVLYNTLFMMGMLGRIGIAVFYYMHVVKRPDLIGIFMSMQMIVGLAVAPIAPAIARKFGVRQTIISTTSFFLIGLAMMIFADPTNIPFLIFAHIVYGLGYLGGNVSSVLVRDAVDHTELKTGLRIDGTVGGFTGFATKTGGAIGSSLALFAIGAAGYVGGQEVTADIAKGITYAVNIVPMICMAISIVPLLFYNITEKGAETIQAGLVLRRAKEAETEAV